MSWVLSPLSWLLLAALLAPLAWVSGSRLLAAASALIAVAAFAASTPLVANTLLTRLERPVPAAPQCQTSPPGTVVVLAGGVDRPPRNEVDFSVMNAASKRRMERGIQYWRERTGRSLVISGGAPGNGGSANADLMAGYARWLGVPDQALRMERHSANTRQNAQYLARLVPGIPRRITLVTSAMHMPRARREFAAAGFHSCPSPTDFRAVRVAPPHGLLPRIGSMVKTHAVLHEFAGIAHFHWHMWISRSRFAGQERRPEERP